MIQKIERETEESEWKDKKIEKKTGIVIERYKKERETGIGVERYKKQKKRQESELKDTKNRKRDRNWNGKIKKLEERQESIWKDKQIGRERETNPDGIRKNIEKEE